MRGLRLGADAWTPCRSCGREHQLVRPRAAAFLTLLAGLTLAAVATGSVGYRVDSTPLMLTGFSLGGALGIYALYSLLNLLFNRQGILSSRNSAVFESITRLAPILGDLEKKVANPQDDCSEQCEQVLAELDEFTGLPRDGEWLRGMALAFNAVSAHQRGRTRNARDYVGRLSQLPKAARSFYWNVFYFCGIDDISEEAVKAYFRVLTKPSTTTEPLVESARAALRKACLVADDMSADELRNRARWNHEAQKLFPEENWPALNEARAWFGLKRFSRCIAVLQDQPTDADNWQSHALLAEAEFREGLTERAESRVADLERWSEERPEIAVEVASIHIRRGQTDRAEPFLDRCEEVGGSAAAMALVIKAKLLLRDGQQKDAQEALAEAVQHDTTNITALILLAEIMSADGRNSEAGRSLAEAAERFPESAPLFVALGRAWWNAGEYTSSADAFETGIRNGALPDSLAVVRAQCLLKVNRFEDAAAVLDQAVDVPEEQDLQAAFYHGVALLQVARGNGGRGASRALPYFANAFKRAKESGDKNALRMARINSINCYRMIAEETFASEKFRESAKAWARLGASFKSGTENPALAAANAAESLFRAAEAALAANKEQIAIECLQQSVKLRRSTAIQMVLGAVLFRTANYSGAEETFARLLEDTPNDERMRFYRALSSARAGESSGKELLSELLQESGKFRLRVALALADMEADAGRFDVGAQTLTDVLTARPDRMAELRSDRFFGESCCKAVLYTVRAGRQSDARKLIEQLLEGQGSSEKILGAILAEVGDFDQSLDVLYEYAKVNNADAHTRRLITGVSVRVGMKHCDKGEFPKAADAVAKGLVKGVDRVVRLLHQMLESAGETDGELSEHAVRLLEKCSEQSKELAALTARPIVVGAQTQMLALARFGDYTRAKKFAAMSRSTWNDKIRRSPRFWQSFIDAYNDGKDYRLETAPQDVAKAVEERLMGFWIQNLRNSIKGEFQEQDSLLPGSGAPDYDAIRFCWSSLKTIVGSAQAVDLARRHIDLLDEVARIDRTLGAEEAVRFVKFAEKELYSDDRLSGYIANKAFEAIIQAAGDYDATRFRQHLGDLISAASGDSETKELRNICKKIKRMGSRVLDRIMSQMSSDSDLRQLSEMNPPIHKQICFQIIIAFAMNQDAIPGGIAPSHVSMFFGQIKGAVLQQAVENAQG